MGEINYYSPKECLMSELLKLLFNKNTDNLEDNIIVVPTLRLSHFLIGALCKTYPAIRPPKIFTIERFFSHFSATSKSLQVIGDNNLDFLISTIILKNDYNYLNPNHSQELRVFYNELIENNQLNNWYPNLLKYFDSEFYKSELHLDHLKNRFEEIKNLLMNLDSNLKSHHLASKSNFNVSVSKEIEDYIENDFFSSYSNIYLVGLTSMADSWQPCIKKLINCENCHSLFYHPPKLLGSLNPLKNLIQNLSDDVLEPIALDHPNQIQLVESKNRTEEISYILDKISFYIDNNQFLPSEIGIIITSESDYCGILADQLISFNHSYNLAISHPLIYSKIGSWLNQLLHSAMNPDNALYFYHWISCSLNLEKFIQFPEDKMNFLSELYENLPNKNDQNSILSNKIILNFKSDKNKGYFKKIYENYIEILDDIRSSQQVSVLSEKIENYLLDISEKSKITTKIELEQSAMSQIIGQLKDLKLLENYAFKSKSINYLLDYFLSSLLKIEIRSTGEPMKGIQILSLSEARNMPFQLVFIVGCNEGSFPKALPSDELIEDSIKIQLNLKGWKGLEAMEDLTFSLLSYRIPYIYLSRSRFIDGKNTVKSRFLENLSAQSKFNTIEVEDRFSKDGLNCSQNQKDPNLFGVISKNLSEQWLKQLSSTSIDSLFTCPYKFALEKLKIKSVDTFFDSNIAIEEGELYHKIFELFHQEVYYEPITLEKIQKQIKRSEFQEYCQARFEKIILSLKGNRFKKSPIYFHLKKISIPRYIDHLININSTNNGILTLNKVMTESAIGKELPVNQILIANKSRYLNGKIDKIEFNTTENYWIITDYKRKFVPKPSDILEVLYPQLLVYGLAFKYNFSSYPLDKLILGYWNLIDGKWQAVAVGEDVKEKAIEMGLAIKKTPLINELVSTFEQKFGIIEKTVLEDGRRFYIDPRNCKFCQFESICRKNDPNLKMTIASNSQMLG